MKHFKYLDRGKKNILGLIPGWATDYRIFGNLNLDFNYLLPIDFSPFDFEKNLIETLNEMNLNKISIFGWSLGGFVAAEFASKYKDIIDKLILVSVRKKYKNDEILKIKRFLKKSKKGYLYKFYSECFSKKEEFSWFKKNLLKDYCENLSLDYLIETLDYLQKTELKINALNVIKEVTIVHSKDDKIAPIEEVISVKENLNNARFVCFENAGHIPFIGNNFSITI